MKSFREIGLACGTDKVSKHGYDAWYEKHFQPLRKAPIRLLEIGIAGGASLRTWEEYFPKAELFAIDLDPRCRAHASSRSTVLIGDQADVGFLQHVIQSVGNGFDIIIDDGGHQMNAQQATFRTLFSALRPGGWFVMEDVETSYYADYGGGPPGKPGTTIAMLKALVDELNFAYHGQANDYFDAAPNNAEWTLLEPESLVAASGVSLRALPDRSIVVGRPSPATDTYIVKATMSLSAINALRLEALPDPSLPQGGPGCAANGNFVVTQVQVRWHSSAEARAVELTSASASFAQTGFAADQVLQPPGHSGWGIDPRAGRPSELVVQFAEPLPHCELGQLTVILQQQYGGQHTLGRFRLSVTNHQPPPRAAAMPTIQAICFYPNICFVQRGPSDVTASKANHV